MDTIVRGLILRTKDYKENDKLLTILTAEEGRILVRAKGVKKQSSKLKAFCQNFCFADFELQNGKTGYLLTGAKGIDSFFDISLDIDKYTYGCAMLEILDKVCHENLDYALLLIETLKCLKALNYENIEPRLVLTKFIMSLINIEGLSLSFDYCNNCKTPLISDTFLDFASGELLCPVCKRTDSYLIEKGVLSTMKILSNNDISSLKTIKINKNILSKTISLLSKYLMSKYEMALNYFSILK